jgi:hypothetical protein
MDGLIVTVTSPGGEPIEMIVKDEGGYKFGYIETYKIDTAPNPGPGPDGPGGPPPDMRTETHG